MAETKELPAEPAAVETPSTGGSTLLPKLKIVGFLVVVIVLQCVLAWLYLPAPEAPAAPEAAHEHAAEEHVAEPIHDDPNAEHQEVDLGQFSLTSFDPTSNTTLLIDFHLYGTIVVEHAEDGADAAGGGHGGHGGHGAKGEAADPLANTKFGKLYKKNKHRIRDQVITIIRNSEMADLADPGLGLIKRQILTKTNALLSEPLLKEVIFSDFAVVEQ